MEKSEALQILNAREEDDLVEALEEATYREASFFMRRTFLPKLAKARISRLRKIEEAALSLGINAKEGGEAIQMEEPLNASPPADWVSWYNREETQLRKALANSNNYKRVANIYELWIAVFEIYRQGFIEAFKKYNGETVTDGPVKLSAAPILHDLAQSSGEERQSLLKNEYKRLKRLSVD